MKKQHNFDLLDWHNQKSGYKCLGVDGKISKVKVPGNQMEKHDKQTVMCQVEKKFVGHFIPENGGGWGGNCYL